MSKQIHISILKQEVLDNLDIQENDVVLDGTLGFAGHGMALATLLGPNGRFIGLDQDIDALNYSRPLFKEFKNADIFQSNYSQIKSCLQSLNLEHVDKVLLDLGVSSFQFDEAGRGFSHRFNATLDMRMNQDSKLTATDILNNYSAQQLSDIFFQYGELRHNKKLAENIVATRSKAPIMTTEDLQTLIKKSYYFYNKRSLFIKCCSQVFQALRIEVNQEFDHLDQFLNTLSSITKTGSRIAIITFHSLEDKRIKSFIKESSDFEFIEKKVIKPSKEERTKNSRSRSAKLRVFYRL